MEYLGRHTPAAEGECGLDGWGLGQGSYTGTVTMYCRYGWYSVRYTNTFAMKIHTFMLQSSVDCVSTNRLLSASIDKDTNRSTVILEECDTEDIVVRVTTLPPSPSPPSHYLKSMASGSVTEVHIPTSNDSSQDGVLAVAAKTVGAACNFSFINDFS